MPGIFFRQCVQIFGIAVFTQLHRLHLKGLHTIHHKRNSIWQKLIHHRQHNRSGITLHTGDTAGIIGLTGRKHQTGISLQPIAEAVKFKIPYITFFIGSAAGYGIIAFTQP